MVNITLFLRLFLRCFDSTVSRCLLSIYSSGKQPEDFTWQPVFPAQPWMSPALHRTDSMTLYQVSQLMFLSPPTPEIPASPTITEWTHRLFLPPSLSMDNTTGSYAQGLCVKSPRQKDIESLRLQRHSPTLHTDGLPIAFRELSTEEWWFHLNGRGHSSLLNQKKPLGMTIQLKQRFFQNNWF